MSDCAFQHVYYSQMYTVLLVCSHISCLCVVLSVFRKCLCARDSMFTCKRKWSAYGTYLRNVSPPLTPSHPLSLPLPPPLSPPSLPQARNIYNNEVVAIKKMNISSGKQTQEVCIHIHNPLYTY